MLNVALGGTLHQHLPDVIGCGQYQLGGHEYNLISVEIRPDSELGLLIDSQVLEAVPVSHHQAVDRLGDGLIATAWSDDQVVEAIEYPGNRFCMGIQWHPEELPEDSVLFRGLITAAQANSSSRLLPAMPTSSTPELNAG
jgi:putative glutamine amidotransferase